MDPPAAGPTPEVVDRGPTTPGPTPQLGQPNGGGDPAWNAFNRLSRSGPGSPITAPGRAGAPAGAHTTVENLDSYPGRGPESCPYRWRRGSPRGLREETFDGRP